MFCCCVVIFFECFFWSLQEQLFRWPAGRHRASSSKSFWLQSGISSLRLLGCGFRSIASIPHSPKKNPHRFIHGNADFRADFNGKVVATQIFFIVTPNWGNDPIWRKWSPMEWPLLKFLFDRWLISGFHNLLPWHRRCKGSAISIGAHGSDHLTNIFQMGWNHRPAFLFSQKAPQELSSKFFQWISGIAVSIFQWHLHWGVSLNLAENWKPLEDVKNQFPF